MHLALRELPQGITRKIVQLPQVIEVDKRGELREA